MERLIERLFGERDQVALAGAGHERARLQHAVLRMPRAGKGLDADELLFAQVDLRLIPELDPAVAQRVAEIDAAGDCRRVAEPQFLQNLQNHAGLERLLENRKHAQVMLLADALDMGEHSRAAVAHELHGAGISGARQRQDALDGVGRFERDVEEDEFWLALGQRRPHRLAVGKLLGIDAGAVQDQRQKVPDAGVGIDDKAKRRAGLGAGRFGVGCRGNGGCLRRCRGHFPDPKRQRDGSGIIGGNLLTVGFDRAAAGRAA